MPASPQKQSSWTAEQDKDLKTLFKKHGDNFRVIKKEMKHPMSVPEIRSRVRHLGLDEEEEQPVKTPQKATPLVPKIIKNLENAKAQEKKLPKSEIKAKAVGEVIAKINRGETTPTNRREKKTKEEPLKINGAVKDKARLYEKEPTTPARGRRGLPLKGVVTPSRQAAQRARKVTTSRLKQSFTAADLEETSPVKSVAVVIEKFEQKSPAKLTSPKRVAKVVSPKKAASPKKSPVKVASPKKVTKVDSPKKAVASPARTPLPRTASKRKALELTPQQSETPQTLGKRSRSEETPAKETPKTVKFAETPVVPRSERSSKRQRLTLETEKEVWSDDVADDEEEDDDELVKHEIPTEYQGFLSSVLYRVGRQLGLL